MNTYYALGVIITWIVLAVGVGAYAERKGHSALAYTIASLLLSPLIGFVAAYFEEDKLAATRSSPATQQPQPGRVDDLARLAGLRDSGALSADEFEREKQRILSRP